MKKYKYKNIKTGAIVYSPFKIVSKNWVEVIEKPVEEIIEEPKEEVEEAVEEETVEKEKEEQADEIDGITKKEIMQELDAIGIKYNPRATKKELYDLMMQGR